MGRQCTEARGGWKLALRGPGGARGGGLEHGGIDDGEASPLRNATPIAVADGRFDPAEVALTFEAEGAAVPPSLYRFVLGRILEGP